LQLEPKGQTLRNQPDENNLVGPPLNLKRLRKGSVVVLQLLSLLWVVIVSSNFSTAMNQVKITVSQLSAIGMHEVYYQHGT
jgi:hypothetical protein